MTIQSITITSVDPIEFLKRVLEIGKKGAVLKDGTYPRIKGIPFVAQFDLEVIDGVELKSAPGINAIPVAAVVTDNVVEITVEKPVDTKVDNKVYTREELEALDWATLKGVAGDVGVSGRDRQQIIRKYLELANTATAYVK